MANSFLRLFFSLSLAILTGTLAAAAAGLEHDNPSRYADLSAYEGIEIDSIVIEARNIYDTDEEEYDRFIFKLANKLHIKTRSRVIRRELLLGEGDLFSAELADETARNLRARLKVYEAWVQPHVLPSGNLLLKVVTIDQWSLKGGLSYRREGNETRYTIGAEEENFLGGNQLISFHYFNQSDDDNFVETKFQDNRFLGQRLRMLMEYSRDPLDGVKRVKLSRPFYRLDQDLSYSFHVAQLNGRKDVYNNSVKIAESTYDADWASTELTYRAGGNYERLDLTLRHRYFYQRTFDEKILSPEHGDSSLAARSLPRDSLYHWFNLEGAYGRYRYITMNNIDGFEYTEDLLLGSFLTVDFGRAFHSDFNSHYYDQVGAVVSQYMSFGSALLFFDYSHWVWIKGGDVLRRDAWLSTRGYKKLSDWLTLAFRGRYNSDWDRDGRNNLILGGTTGIRGYDKFFRTGNRRFILNTEARFFSSIRFLSALFGAALFSDCGSVWKEGEELSTEHFYASAGAGLRIGFEKSTKNVVRIDLAYSKAGGLELSIGTDQYFFAQ